MVDGLTSEDVLHDYAKKIDAAFQRLQSKRAAVGNTEAPEETPEQEAARIQKDMAAASCSGNISALLSLIAETSALKPADYINQTVGNVRFLYYMFVEKFSNRPIDLIDMIDGLLYLDARVYTQKQAIAHQRAKSGGRP